MALLAVRTGESEWLRGRIDKGAEQTLACWQYWHCVLCSFTVEFSSFIDPSRTMPLPHQRAAAAAVTAQGCTKGKAKNREKGRKKL